MATKITVRVILMQPANMASIILAFQIQQKLSALTSTIIPRYFLLLLIITEVICKLLPPWEAALLTGKKPTKQNHFDYHKWDHGN